MPHPVLSKSQKWYFIMFHFTCVFIYLLLYCINQAFY